MKRVNTTSIGDDGLVLDLAQLSVRHVQNAHAAPRSREAHDAQNESHENTINASSPALSNLNLRVQAGEQIAVIGPSGAGKTTLLRTLACAHAPISHVTSRFHLFGQDPWRLSTYDAHLLRARLFLAPQVPPLPPRQRVVTAVLAGLLPRWSLFQAVRSLLYPRDVALAERALTPFNMQTHLYSRVDRLSGGERQRVSLARALASQAELFLLDEPLSALDPTLSHITLQALQNAASQRNVTLICSLHQVELAHAQFPRLIGLREGSIMFDAAREEVTPAMLQTLYAGTHDNINALDNAQSTSFLTPSLNAFPTFSSSGRCN